MASTSTTFTFEGFESWDDLRKAFTLEELNSALKVAAAQKHYHGLYNAKKTAILRKVKELGLEKSILEGTIEKA